MSNFPGKSWSLLLGDIGEICGDQVIAALDVCKKVTLQKDRIQAVVMGVFPRQAEGSGRDISKYDALAPVGKGKGEGNSDHSAAGSHIEKLSRPGEIQFQNRFDKLLGFGPGNQGPAVTGEVPAEELYDAQEMLERLTLSTPFQRFPER